MRGKRKHVVDPKRDHAHVHAPGHAHGGHGHGHVVGRGHRPEHVHELRGDLARGAGMGKVLFLDCFSGIAGDMLAAAPSGAPSSASASVSVSV